MVSGPTSSALCRCSEEGQSARSQQWLHLPCPGPCTRTPLPPFCGPHRCPENWLWGEGVVLPPHYRGEAGVSIWPPDSQVLAFTRGTEVFRALNLGKKCVNSFSKFHNHQGNPKTLISRAEFKKVKACSNFESLTPLFSILGCKQWKAALTFLSRRERIGGQVNVEEGQKPGMWLLNALWRREGQGGGQDQVARALDQLARETLASAHWAHDLECFCPLEEDPGSTQLREQSGNRSGRDLC